MARGRRLTKAEQKALSDIIVILIRGYFSPIAQNNGSLWIVLGAYGGCFILAIILMVFKLSVFPAVIVAAIVAVVFAAYHYLQEQKEFERQYHFHNAQFAPPYDARFALPAGRNKIYAYKIASKQHEIKVGQTTERTADRIHNQLKTANIEPDILWEFYAKGKSGKAFTDYALHQFLVNNGYEQIKAATGRKTEWFFISNEALHKEAYRFYYFH